MGCSIGWLLELFYRRIKEPPSPAPLSGEAREFLTFRTSGQKKVEKGLLKY